VKLNLGAFSTPLEISDEEMAEIIREHTLPVYSKYNPLIRYYRCTFEENLVTENPTYIYEIKNFNYKIIKINNVIPKASIDDLNQVYSQALAGVNGFGDVTDYLMAMNILHMQNIAVADHTWRFFPPNRIEIMRTADGFLTFSSDFIAELACVHPDPTTVNPDLYLYLRDLALADMMIYIGRIRYKFSSFATPYGQVELPARELIDEGNQLRRETIESLKNLPPDDFLFFLN
jgi:hypothetical protein